MEPTKSLPRIVPSNQSFSIRSRLPTRPPISLFFLFGIRPQSKKRKPIQYRKRNKLSHDRVPKPRSIRKLRVPSGTGVEQTINRESRAREHPTRLMGDGAPKQKRPLRSPSVSTIDPHPDGFLFGWFFGKPLRYLS